jgi:hypothetical protein
MIHNAPILKLANDEQITCLFVNEIDSSVLIGTSKGDVIKQNKISHNIFGTGPRKISCKIEDGFGNASEVFDSSIIYAFYKQIIKVTEEKETSVLQRKIMAYPIVGQPTVSGIFISPVLWGGSDFGYWESLSIRQNCPEECENNFYIRVGNTSDDVLTKSWYSLYNGSDSDIEIPFNIAGSYIQLKINLTTTSTNIKPYVYETILSYRTKHAVFFFTKKFLLERDTNAKHALFAATYTAPPATEIKFGITDSNTNNWDNYKIIEPNKMIDLPDGLEDRFKIGVKMISNSPTQTPTVDEFSFSFDGDKKNRLM